MPLNESKVKAIQPAEKAFRVADGNGLFIEVSPKGKKSWVLRADRGGVNTTKVIGKWPQMSVVEARRVSQSGDVQIGVVTERPKTVLEVAEEWRTVNSARWKDRHRAELWWRLEKDAFPKLGKRPIAQVKAPEMLEVLRAVEDRGAIESARRMLHHLNGIFDYAVAAGIIHANPIVSLKRALKPAPKVKHRAARTSLEELRQMIADAEATPASPVTKLAVRLALLTACRPGEIRGAVWEEFEGLDGDEPVWRIPAARMKMNREHVVPLSRQAVEIIEAVRTLTGKGPFLFPNATNSHKIMSENAMGYYLNRAGYHGRQTAHGLRSSFATIMNERHRPDADILDLMLAHSPKDEIAAAYNRAEHFPRRRELAQIWADLALADARPALDLLKGPRRS